MAKTTKHRISDQLRELIDSCGQTRYAISKQTAIDESTLTRFMSGERGLSMKALDRLGECLDLQVSYRKSPKAKGK